MLLLNKNLRLRSAFTEKMERSLLLFFLILAVIICIVGAAAEAAPVCEEKVYCAHGHTPKKMCGKWFCYRVYRNIPMEWVSLRFA